MPRYQESTQGGGLLALDFDGVVVKQPSLRQIRKLPGSFGAQTGFGEALHRLDEFVHDSKKIILTRRPRYTRVQ